VITRRFLAAVALLIVGAAPVAADEPTDRLRIFFERANQVILAPDPERGGLEERLIAVRGLVNEILDVEGAAALALGRHWETLSPPARAAFTRLYADVMERAYLSWIGSKARLGEGGVSIRWLDESIDGDSAVVTSELLTRTGGELPVVYRMVRRPTGWLVRDVVVDGVSLAANYRVQFERVMQLGSYEELLQRLHDKAGPVARAQASAAAPTGIVVAELRDAPAAVATDIRPIAVSRPASSPPVDALAVPTVVTPPAVKTAPTVAAPLQEPARVSARPAARREFWVQVGAFRTADAATRLVQRLRRHAVMIATGGDRLAPVLRVLVGPFAERTAAAAAARSLQASGIAAFVPDPAE
jgi:phospholipid transport system substrate-binding protein